MKRWLEVMGDIFTQMVKVPRFKEWTGLVYDSVLASTLFHKDYYGNLIREWKIDSVMSNRLIKRPWSPALSCVFYFIV